MFSRNTIALILILIFCVSFFLRWFRISEYLFFGYEQGRDALIIQKIYQLKDFVLVGPSTSIGGLFHGPWYYYMMALPYGLSGGDPLAASLFLIILGSLVPVGVLVFASDLFKSKMWGVICSILVTFSFEYILYSRWLSNVSPAPLFVMLSFFMLWKYLNLKDMRYFLGFSIFSSVASLFQMILIPQFLFVLVLLLIFRQLRLPSLKTITLSFPVMLVLFGPMIIFDFRNDHITFNSLLNVFAQKDTGFATLASNINMYLLQLYQHNGLALLYINYPPVQVFLIVSVLAGAVLGYLKGHRKVAYFLLSWILMTLPLIKISPGNPQYYVGAGLGWIFLFCFSMKNLWEVKYLRIIPVIFAFLVLISFYLTLSSLFQNQDVFFRTIQDDLNYADQRRVLEFVHNDSQGQPYRLVSFTIPSLQPEAWDYLKGYFYPDDPQADAKLIYIVIEKHVYPVWEEKWINDLGRTQLIYEKKFGLLRLQKREIID